MTMHVIRDYHSMSCAVKKIIWVMIPLENLVVHFRTYPKMKSVKVIKNTMKLIQLGASLMVQWLRFHAPNAGGLGSIPGQGTRSCMRQLRPSAAKLIKKKKKEF